MASEIEYALMAGVAYRSTRGQINRFPIPQGWNEIPGSHRDLPSGFEAISFTNGTEIVISFAGTYPSDIFGDQAANIGLGLGNGSVQLIQAAEYYLQVKAANPPGTIISFTGHSLGGGLASLMAVFFGETATTFAQAPFRNSANITVANGLMSYLSDPARGYNTPELTQTLARALQRLTNFTDAAACLASSIYMEPFIVVDQGDIDLHSVTPDEARRFAVERIEFRAANSDK